MNEAAALPSPAVLFSARLDRHYGRLRFPPGSRPLPGSSPVIGRERSGALRRPPDRGGSPRSPSPPSQHSEPITPGSPSGLRSRLSTPSMAFAVTHSARLSLFHPKTAALTARQASLDATDRWVAPPKGLSTLGFDPARFQTEPPARYRASRQQPGRDSHPQATTSSCQIRSSQPTSSNYLAHCGDPHRSAYRTRITSRSHCASATDRPTGQRRNADRRRRAAAIPMLAAPFHARFETTPLPR